MILTTLFRQLFHKPLTNPFPAKYMPRSVTGFLGKVASGDASIHPPVPVPADLRGKLSYDRDKCIGCKLCMRVCPANVIEFLPEDKKIRIYVARCTFCAQCVDACPVDALATTPEFLLADTDRFSSHLIVDGLSPAAKAPADEPADQPAPQEPAQRSVSAEESEEDVNDSSVRSSHPGSS